MKAKSPICSDQEYLQAHLTVIRSRSRGSAFPVMYSAGQHIAPILKVFYGWIAKATARRPGNLPYHEG